MTPDEFKQQYPFYIERNVEWAEMDAFQHVNNTVYFRYFEKVRFDFFETRGFAASKIEQGIGPILASTQCKFKMPLTYPDKVLIGTYITDLEDDRFLMKYAIYSLQHSRIAADGDGVIVCYDYNNNKKALIPDVIRKMLEES